MTVDELRQVLADLPGDVPVVVVYETGSHLSVGQALHARSWDYKDGALFLDADEDDDSFRRGLEPA